MTDHKREVWSTNKFSLTTFELPEHINEDEAREDTKDGHSPEKKNTAKRNTQGRATLLKQRTLMTTLRKWNMSGPM